MNHATAETSAILHLLVRAMVTDKDSVHITNTLTKHGVTFHVHVSRGEAGKMIGAQGRIARSLRIVLMSIGKQNGLSYGLFFEETRIPSMHSELNVGTCPRTYEAAVTLPNPRSASAIASQHEHFQSHA